MLTCKHCDKEFKPSRKQKQTFCSILCYRASQKKPARFCKECNIEIVSKDAKKFCSKSCSGTYNNRKKMQNGWTHSPEAIEKIRKHAIENPRGWAKNPSLKGPGGSGRRTKDPAKWTTSVCEDCGTVHEHYKIRPKKYCSPECANKNKYHPNSTRKTRSIYKEFQMDSGSELEFAKLCDEHNIKWVKNSTIAYEYTNSKNEIRNYYPDFYLEEYDAWVEIKSKYYLREDDDLRWASVPKHEVIWSDNITLPLVITN